MSAGPEFTYVEQPFLDQLVRMGWKHTTGSLHCANTLKPLPRGRSGFYPCLVGQAHGLPIVTNTPRSGIAAPLSKAVS